jgi:hypothetical protein
VLFVNRKLGIAHDVDEQDMRDLKLNLLCGIGGHDHFGANEATIFKVSKEPRIKRIARIGLRHEDQACRVRQLLAAAIRVSIHIHSGPDDFATQLLVNHLFIRFIRAIRGSIVFRR